MTRTEEARGLLWLMEEEGVQPGGSEETMLERLFSYYGPAQGENKGDTLSPRIFWKKIVPIVLEMHCVGNILF